MPYYVYAIHTDSNINRLYDSFDDFDDAVKLEEEMKRGRCSGDNYLVYMMHADNDALLKGKINDIRKENDWPYK